MLTGRVLHEQVIDCLGKRQTDSTIPSGFTDAGSCAEERRVENVVAHAEFRTTPLETDHGSARLSSAAPTISVRLENDPSFA